MSFYAMQLFMSAIGSAAFAMIFHVEHRFLPPIAFGGFLCWLSYLGGEMIFRGVFLPSLAASLVVALYAEILARVCKAPSTPFFAVSEMPLFPGGSLYNCMRSAIEGNDALASQYGYETFAIALGIAGGMSIVWALCYSWRALARRRREMLHKR